MAYTNNYNLYIGYDDTTKAKDWFDEVAGTSDSNMIKIDTALKNINDEISLNEIVNTKAGSIVNFNDGINKITPLKTLIANINPVQDLHGYDYPWAGGAGKNLLPNKETATVNKVTFTLESDGGYTLSGTANGNAAFDIGRDVFSLPAGTYTLTMRGNSNAECSLFKIVEGTATYFQGGNSTFAISEETSLFVRLLVRSEITASGKAYIQIEAGSTATAYEPYSNICPITGWDSIHVYHSGADTSDPETVTVEIPTPPITVYGGTLNVTSGELVVDKVLKTLSNLSSTASWFYYSQYSIFKLDDNIISPGDIGQNTNLTCSCYKAKPYNYNSAYSNETGIVWSHISGSIIVRDNRFDNVVEWLADVGNQTLCFPLIEPQTYHLTPQEVKTLLGTNTIWADSGDVTVEYIADTKKYIDEKFTELAELISNI